MPAPGSSFPVIRYATVASTNAVALDLAHQGAAHGTVVIAAQQDHGRGRGVKSFASPAGGLYMSVILRPDLGPERLPLITLAAGVACAKSVEELIGQAIFLKWPNDLYVQGRKLGGILAETGPCSSAAPAVAHVVIGIGINVNTPSASFPPDLRNRLTSLYDVQPQPYDLDALMARIHGQLELQVPALGHQAGKVLADWQKRDYLLGRDISWQDATGRIRQGRGAGIRADGCYQLRAADGTMAVILAGEVSIGPVVE